MALLDLALNLLTSDLIGEIAPPGQQWGIFQNGAPVVVCDSVQDMSYRQEWSISDAPQEQGAFTSFDKVWLPFDVRVRFNAGSAAQRQAMISSIAAIAGTTNLYDVVTPDAVYNSVSISHQDYRRAANKGLGLLSIEVWCLWIQQVGTAAGNNTAQPSGADPTVQGAVQPGTATPSQTTAVYDIPSLESPTPTQ
jgi:hypothetical protein